MSAVARTGLALVQRVPGAIRRRIARARGDVDLVTYLLPIDGAEATTRGDSTPAWQFRRASPEEVRRAPERFGIRECADVDAARHGACYVGEVGGRQIHHVWVRPLRECGADTLEQVVDVDVAGFVHTAATDPAFRGRGVFAAALRWLAVERARGGDQWLVACALSHNAPAPTSSELGTVKGTP